jgi:hypothetical protein
MRKWAIAGAFLASCTIAAAQETAPPAEAPAKGITWFPWLSGSPSKTTASKALTPADLPPAIEPPATRISREQSALQRRNEVIIQLRLIAQKTGDTALAAQADELQDRAFDLYLHKVDQINADRPLETPRTLTSASAKSASPAPSPALEDRR